MFPADWVLALLLLTGPAPANRVPDEMFKRLHVPMTALALQMELLDKRETKHTLVRESEFGEDVLMLRKRFEEMRGAPFLKDASRFPERTHINAMLVWNRYFLKHVQDLNREGLIDLDELARVSQQTNRLYEVLDVARDAQCKYYYVTVRRLALRKLRTLLDENDYRQGQLPPPISFWHLRLFAQSVMRMP